MRNYYWKKYMYGKKCKVEKKKRRESWKGKRHRCWTRRILFCVCLCVFDLFLLYVLVSAWIEAKPKHLLLLPVQHSHTNHHNYIKNIHSHHPTNKQKHKLAWPLFFGENILRGREKNNPQPAPLYKTARDQQTSTAPLSCETASNHHQNL